MIQLSNNQPLTTSTTNIIKNNHDLKHISSPKLSAKTSTTEFPDSSPSSISTTSISSKEDQLLLNGKQQQPPVPSSPQQHNQSNPNSNFIEDEKIKQNRSSIKSTQSIKDGNMINNYPYQNYELGNNHNNTDDSISIIQNNSAQSTINYSHSITTNETLKLPLPQLTSKNLKQQDENNLNFNLNSSSLTSSKSNNNDHYSINGSTNNLNLRTHQTLSPHLPINNESNDNTHNNNNNSPSTPTSFKGSRSEVSDLSHDTIPSSIENLDDDNDLDSINQPTIINSRIIETPSGEHSQFQFQLHFNNSNNTGSNGNINSKAPRVSLDSNIGPLEIDSYFKNTLTNNKNKTDNDEATIKESPLEMNKTNQNSQQSKESLQPIESSQLKTSISKNEIPKKSHIVTNASNNPSLEKPISNRRHTSPSTNILLKRSSTTSENNNIDKKSTKFSIDTSTNLSRKSLNIERRPTQSKTFPISSIRSSSHYDLPRTSGSDFKRMRDSIVHRKNHTTSKKQNLLDDDKVIVGNKISEGHENFVMAYNMLTGIRVAVSRCSGVMRRLNDENFKNYQKLSFNVEGNELTPSSKYDFKFKDYCPEVFRELRACFGIDPADYLISITGKYILSELGSPGKSGSFFYYSRDYRFIIKTIHHSEHKQLLKMLKPYYEHVKQNPNTLLSQFYGLHRVKMSMFGRKSKKVHFVVMNNLFPPHKGIHIKYDLKGSTWGRFTTVKPEDLKKHELSQYTLKDQNWLINKEKIKFGPEKRSIFLNQLEKDVSLLKKVNVMDYSLLLGIHDVKKGKNDQDNIGNKLSVFEPKSTKKSAIINTNPRDINRLEDLPNDVFPGRSKYIFYGHDGGIRATNIENLPMGEIYYLGIIDCLTNYNFKKWLETFFRSFAHPKSQISAIPSKDYGDRFYNFIKNGITNDKQKQN
ncbi:MSS4 [Candida pseudojiufengensis]|uniref:MSS4 n=1 Tax=Candida pseudojiufengensis TaxID=497109 RepID=UPI002224809F|nr:MSS4 [Candida pseudojiufengensis]KAI5959619.1 MSS4 [Candida pseudojiufengensis]